MVRKVNRRFFLKATASFFGIFFSGLWVKMVHVQQINQKPEKIALPLASLSEINFFHDFIVVGNSPDLIVLSSKCTHLGCRISASSNNQLLCPCHGSTFDSSGDVVKGPAIAPLPKLPFEISQDKKTVTVYLS